MSAFILKIIALVTMTCDHISYLIFGHFSPLNYIGRIAFPIFAFQISEGYIHTKNLKNYLLRLFLFALISQVPFMLFLSIFSSKFSLNIFFTLFLGLVSITIYDKLNKVEYSNKYVHYLYNLLGILCAIFISFIAEITHCDYGYFGIAIIFVFFLFKKNKPLMNLAFILCTIIFYFKNLLISPLYNTYLLIIVFTLVSLLFINLYNNKKGKDTKYILYLFYPIHLLIIYLLSFLPIFPIS